MSNQSFDSNDAASFSGSGSGAEPIPIFQRLRQQDYLSNIQDKMDEVLRASGIEETDEHVSSMIPSSSSAQSSSSSAPARVNKMDSFFEQIAAEEEAAANEIAEQLASTGQTDNASFASGEGDEHYPAEYQQEPAFIQEDSAEILPEAPQEILPEALQEVLPEASVEAPQEALPTDSRPTGYAGLSAGLAAAGLGNLGARLAEESISEPSHEFVTEESHFSTQPPALPSNPMIPVVAPSSSEPRFDLEAARLEEVSGPVFSQEFDEKELSPEERLANRLQREKLVSSENRLADQLIESLDRESTSDQLAIDHGDAEVASPTPPAESALHESEPIADLFVEVPQVPQLSEVDQVSFDRPEVQVQPSEILEEQAPYVIDQLNQPLDDTSSRKPAPSAADLSDAAASEPPVLLRQPVPPQMQDPEPSIDPRLLEAKRLEDEFRALHKQEESHIEQAQLEKTEYERATKEGINGDQQEVRSTDEAPESEQERLAAIEQAERVKAAREKAIQVAQEPDSAPSSATPVDNPDLSQQEINPTPQPMELTGESQFTNQPNLIQPVPLPTGSPFHSLERLDVKRPVAGHQFQNELFYKCMLEHLTDGVIFVDHKQRVKMWSRGAEKATGIIPEVVLDRPLLPQTINLCDTNGNGLQLDKCPVAASLRTLEIVSGEFKISNGTNFEGMKVELTAIPVIDENRYVNGAVVMFHDRTAHVNLQRQLKDLYEFSVLDPLTQVANRAEFERVQQEYVLAFQQSDDFNCSIIICDIDYFKSINDNFGHAVGDEALMSFASMLKRYVRPQDLVARYGGEEFVILCADCDTGAAVQRAEEIRMALYKTPQPMLGGKSISASFGVSELREGDTALDFFVRADTALLEAKETGRNRVIASDGSSPNGPDEQATELSETGIRWSAQQRKSQALICEEFKTETPIQVLVEKLRGFIIENDAVLQRVEPEFLSMEVEVESPVDYSKKGAFTMNVEFKETETPTNNNTRTKTLNYIRATIYAGRMKSWFSTNNIDLAPHLLGELRRFLMIGDKASRISVDMATEKVR